MKFLIFCLINKNTNKKTFIIIIIIIIIVFLWNVFLNESSPPPNNYWFIGKFFYLSFLLLLFVFSFELRNSFNKKKKKFLFIHTFFSLLRFIHALTHARTSFRTHFFYLLNFLFKNKIFNKVTFFRKDFIDWSTQKKNDEAVKFIYY